MQKNMQAICLYMNVVNMICAAISAIIQLVNNLISWIIAAHDI